MGSNLLGRGIVMMLVANLLFSVVDTSTKWLIAGGLVAIQMAFMRYAIHFAITLVDSGARLRGRRAISTRTRALIVLRAFCLISGTSVNFIALGHLPLSVSSAILYLSPVFICLFARPILGEIISVHHWIGIGFGFLGVLLILVPWGEPFNWYAVLMLYPAGVFALYQVLTRKLSGAVPPSTLQFYTGLLGTVVLLPFAYFAWVTPTSPLQWGLLLSIGAFAWLGHEILTRAHAFSKASTLAPFGYSFVIYLSIAGMLVFNEVPQVNVVIGALVIISSGLYVWRNT